MIDSTEVVIDTTNRGSKPMQFKIETPIVTVESDTDNHLVDVATVVITILGLYVLVILFKKWMKQF